MSANFLVYLLLFIDISIGNKDDLVLKVGGDAVFHIVPNSTVLKEDIWCSGKVAEKIYSEERGDTLFCPTAINGTGALTSFNSLETLASLDFTEKLTLSLTPWSKVVIGGHASVSGENFYLEFPNDCEWTSKSIDINATEKGEISFEKDSHVKLDHFLTSHGPYLAVRFSQKDPVTLQENVSISGESVHLGLDTDKMDIGTSITACSTKNLTFDVRGVVNVGSSILLENMKIGKLSVFIRNGPTIINIGSGEKITADNTVARGNLVITSGRRIEIYNEGRDNELHVQGSVIITAPYVLWQFYTIVCIEQTLEINAETIDLNQFDTEYTRKITVRKLVVKGNTTEYDTKGIVVKDRPNCKIPKRSSKAISEAPQVKCKNGEIVLVDQKTDKNRDAQKSSSDPQLVYSFMNLIFVNFFRFNPYF